MIPNMGSSIGHADPWETQNPNHPPLSLSPAHLLLFSSSEFFPFCCSSELVLRSSVLRVRAFSLPPWNSFFSIDMWLFAVSVSANLAVDCRWKVTVVEPFLLPWFFVSLLAFSLIRLWLEFGGLLPQFSLYSSRASLLMIVRLRC